MATVEEKMTFGNELTYGDRMVGLTFNPSGSAKVTRLKTLFAEIIDICANELAELDEPNGGEVGPIWREAIMRSLDAQMWTVKGATWRK